MTKKKRNPHPSRKRQPDFQPGGHNTAVQLQAEDESDIEFNKKIEAICEEWRSFFNVPYTGVNIHGVAYPPLMKEVYAKGFETFRRELTAFYKKYGICDWYGEEYLTMDTATAKVTHEAAERAWDEIAAYSNGRISNKKV